MSSRRPPSKDRALDTRLSAEEVGRLAIALGHVDGGELVQCIQSIESKGAALTGEEVLAALVEAGKLTPEQSASLCAAVSDGDPMVPTPAPSHGVGIRELARRLDISDTPTLINDPNSATAVRVSTPRPATTDPSKRAERILAETRVAGPVVAGSPAAETLVDVPVQSKHRGDVSTRAVAEETSPRDATFETAVALDTDPGVPAYASALPNDLQKYILGSELGRGGMGIVHAAQDQDLGRTVAFKTLHDESSTDETLIRALIGEARLTGQLQHPNIIPVYDLGLGAAGGVFYTMKLVGRTHLFDVLRGLRRGEEGIVKEYTLLRLLNIFQRMCMALSYAHSRGVVHRDIKPDNVLLGDFGEVQLMDWGIAKVLKSSKASVFTGSGVVAGTPEYMSPEQAAGDDDRVDHRSDIYSLGIILYEMLTLELPVWEEDMKSDLVRLKSLPFEPPHERTPERNMPPELSVICMRALAHDAAKRYNDAGDLWRDIEEVLEGSKQRELARLRAGEEVERGHKATTEYRSLLEEQDELRNLVEAWERQATPWDPENERRQLWDWKNRIRSLDVVLGRAFAEAYKFYQRALGYDPTSDPAREGISRLFDTRIQIAERDQDVAHLVYFSDLRRELWPDDVVTQGSLTLRSHPEGADVYLFGSDEIGGRLVFDQKHHVGCTPVHEIDVAAGGYLVVARLDGFRDAHMAIVVQGGRRDAHMLLLNDWATAVPFVGRAEEFGRLALQHRLVLERERLRAVLICGEQGSGKGRFLQAIDETIEQLPEAHLYMFIDVLSSNRAVPYSAFAALLRQRIGVSSTDPVDRVKERLTDFTGYSLFGVRNHQDLDPDQLRDVQELVDELCPMPGLLRPTEPVEEEWITADRDALAKAVMTVMEQIATRLPVVLILRNIQWIDRASWELVESIRAQLENSPILVIATTNPESLDSPGARWEGFHETIHLQNLRYGSVAHLFREVLKGPVSDELVQAVHHYTGGFPYAVERVVRGVIEGKHVVQLDASYVLDDEGAARLRGQFNAANSVERRLDSLPEGAREVLKAGSIFGNTFWLDGLTAASVADAPEHIDALVRAEFVLRNTHGELSSPDAYRFRYGIERRNIAALVESERASELHLKIAAWMKKREGLSWLGRRADHLRDGGNGNEAARCFESIGDAAASLAAWVDASTAYSEAFECAEKDALRARVHIKRIGSLVEIGALEKARDEAHDLPALERHLDRASARKLAVWREEGIL